MARPNLFINNEFIVYTIGIFVQYFYMHDTQNNRLRIISLLCSTFVSYSTFSFVRKLFNSMHRNTHTHIYIFACVCVCVSVVHRRNDTGFFNSFELHVPFLELSVTQTHTHIYI